MASKYLCIIHGPSPMVVQDDRKQCGRCVKRSQGRTEQDAPKEVCPVVRRFKKVTTEIPKGTRSAYLQVVIVPPSRPKHPDMFEQSRLKRLKREKEVAEIQEYREERMRGMCKSYELPTPVYYSPFVCHPVWIDERRESMVEYLHNVQAVLQSFERRDTTHNLEEVRSKENRLYRTTRRAAWRAIYIREAAPMETDILPDQKASAAYREFLRHVGSLVGGRPPIASPDDCSATYTTIPRIEGHRRRFSINTYRANKYTLMGYRHQRNHKYPVPYMTKSTIRLNQIVYPRPSGKKNLSIMKHLRTVKTLRKLFYHHNEEFQYHFKLHLVEHAIDLNGPEISRRWREFLSSGNPPEKVKHLLKMASFIAATKNEAKEGPDYCVWDDQSKSPECLYLSKPRDKLPDEVAPKIKELLANA